MRSRTRRIRTIRQSRTILHATFLMHDGRACDAIEAAFMHDGPAIKKLGVIEGVNGLTATQLRELRAFLYSL